MAPARSYEIKALEAAGIIFINANGNGAGVRLGIVDHAQLFKLLFRRRTSEPLPSLERGNGTGVQLTTVG